MNRLLIGAAAAVCALSLAACNDSELAALQGAASTLAPNLPPSAVVSDVLASAGVSAATVAKVNADIAVIQQKASAACKIKPLGSGLLNIGIALSPTLSQLAASTPAQWLGGAVTISCNALASAPTYTGFAHRKGEMVTVYLDIGGFQHVPVYGIRQ